MSRREYMRPGADFPSVRRDQGQAVTEYLLVLVVVVGIALGVLYQFNTAFKKYVQSYFGDYLACLLEVGELPTLGGDNGANVSICGASFKPFTLSEGRPLLDKAGDTGGKNSIKMAKSSGEKPAGSRGGNPRKNSKVTKNGSTMNGERVGGEGGDGDDVSARLKKDSKSDKGGSDFGWSYRRRGQNDRGQIPIDSRYSMGKDERAEQKTPKVKTLAAKDPTRKPKRKIAVSSRFFGSEKKESAERDVNFTIGDWLRYILIAAIIIAVLFFLVNQLNQVRKSYDSAG